VVVVGCLWCVDLVVRRLLSVVISFVVDTALMVFAVLVVLVVSLCCDGGGVVVCWALLEYSITTISRCRWCVVAVVVAVVVVVRREGGGGGGKGVLLSRHLAPIGGLPGHVLLRCCVGSTD